MTSGFLGSPQGNVLIPVQNFLKRSKHYALTVSISGTNIANPTYPTGGAIGIAYADSTGNWRLRFNMTCRFDSATITNATIAVTGVVFYAQTNAAEAITCYAFGANVAAVCYTTSGGGNIGITIPSTASVTGFYLSGDVPLDAEPAWYAANAENSVSATAYIPSASASSAGLLSYYDTASYTSQALTDGGTGGVANVYATRVGNLVTITANMVTGSGSPTAAPYTGAVLAAAFRPSQTVFAFGGIDTGGSKNNYIQIETSGVITFVSRKINTTLTATGAEFAASTTYNGFTLSFVKY